MINLTLKAILFRRFSFADDENAMFRLVLPQSSFFAPARDHFNSRLCLLRDPQEKLERGGLDATAAAAEVTATIDRCVSYAGWADKYQSLFSSLNPVAGPHFNFTLPESMGVVGVVAPARPALLGLLGAVLPIITSGNTVLVIASEADPRTPLVFGEALATSDLPGGVINIITGRASELLVHLAKHMDVSALDLHGVEPSLLKKAEEAAVGSVKRVRTRSLDDAAWFDAQATTSPRWIERFVELKTI